MDILLSAPYLIPVFSEYEGAFSEKGISVIIAEVDERLSADDLMHFAGAVDGVICGDDQFTKEVLEAFAPRLKVISKWGTGIDSIDQETAEKVGIRVFNTPGAFTDPVADSVLSYILAFARRTIEVDRQMKSGSWVKLPGYALSEQSIGVVGVGNIGKAVLSRAYSFGMTLLGNDIVSIDPAFLERFKVQMVPLNDLLRGSDYVSLNCDLNPSSHHLMNSDAFDLMKRSAYLVNTARGAVVDEVALVAALEDGRIAGAGLDVFEEEPLPASSPLQKMENVLLAPHNANSSPSAWERVHQNTIQNLLLGLGFEA